MDNIEIKAFSAMGPAEAQAYSAGYNVGHVDGYQLGFFNGYAAGVSTAQYSPKKSKIPRRFWFIFAGCGLVTLVALLIFLTTH